MKNFLKGITDKFRKKSKEPVIVNENNVNIDDAPTYFDNPVSIWDYQEKPRDVKTISKTDHKKSTPISEKKSNTFNSIPYFYRRELKVEKNVKVSIIYFDSTLSSEEKTKYISYIFNNYIGYFVFVRFDGSLSKCIYNDFSSKENNIKYLTTFFNASLTVDSDISFLENIKLLSGIESRIVVPGMITLEEATEEQKKYAEEYAKRKKKYDEEIKRIEEEEKKQREDERKRREKEREELNNKLKEGITENTEVSNSPNNNPSFNEEKTSFGKLYQEKVGIYPKPYRKPRPLYPIWEFKPSKPIYDVSLDTVSFVGRFSFELSNNIDKVKEIKRTITPFTKKNVEFDFYSTTVENIQTLALLGFKRIELLYNKFE